MKRSTARLRPPTPVLHTFLGALLGVVVALVGRAEAEGARSGAVHPRDDVAFVALAPARATTKLLGVEPVVKGQPGALVTVRVECPRDHPGGIEALAFRLTPKGRAAAPLEVRRVTGPTYGRAGRSATPERPCTYTLLVPVDDKVLQGARVEVLELSAWLGDAPAHATGAEPPVEVGRPKVTTEFDPGAGASLPRTTLALRNLLPRPVDVVLRADYVSPKTATTLLAAHLGPGEATQLVVASLPLGGSAEYPGAELRRVQVVDWSTWLDDGEARARAEFTAAWKRWHRLPAGALPVTADVHVELRAAQGGFACDGQLEVTASGAVVTRFQDGPSAPQREQAARFLARAAEHVARPTATQALGERPRLAADAPDVVVQLARHPLDDELALPRLAVLRDGAVRAFVHGPDGGGLREDWDVVDDGAAWRVLERRTQQSTGDPRAVEIERVEWARAGGPWLPARVTYVLPAWVPGFGHECVVTFAGWRSGAAALADLAPPAGPLADELRLAWDGFHRHPRRDVRLGGRVVVTSNGSDGVWIGRKRVAGEFVFEGFFDAVWRRTEVRLDDARATADERARLANAVCDRFSFWRNRDLCNEPLFVEAFRGVRLGRDGDWITIEGGRYLGVRVADGKVAALRLANGEVRTFTWRRVDGALVPTVLQRGEERITLEWRALGDGWLWPVRCTFEDIFEDWSSETLECPRVTVEPLVP